MEPKFQWKREFPIGELQLMPSQELSTGLLAIITDKTLDTEANNNNIVKDEIVTDNENLPTETTEDVTDELDLVSIQPLPGTSSELLDTTQNSLVSLPIETSADVELMDATATLQTETQPTAIETSTSTTKSVSELPVTVCCSINLPDISVKLVQVGNA